MSEAAAVAMLAAARLGKATHLHLKEAMRRPKVTLRVGEAAQAVCTASSLHHHPAHAGRCQIWLGAHLVDAVSVGTLVAVFTPVAEVELAHVGFE